MTDQEIREFAALTQSISTLGAAIAAVTEMFRPDLRMAWRPWVTDPSPPLHPGFPPPCHEETVSPGPVDPEPDGAIDYDLAEYIIDTVQRLSAEVAGISASDETIGIITEEAILQWMESTPEHRARFDLPADVDVQTWRWAAWKAGASSRASEDTYNRQSVVHEAAMQAWCARPDVIAYHHALYLHEYGQWPCQYMARCLANGEKHHGQPFNKWLPRWLDLHRNDRDALFYAAHMVSAHNLIDHVT